MTEEIIAAMKYGASYMFLKGLIAEHRRYPEQVEKALAEAAEQVSGPIDLTRWRERPFFTPSFRGRPE